MNFMESMRQFEASSPLPEDVAEFRSVLLRQMTCTEPDTEEYALLNYLQEHYRKVSEAECGDYSPF